MMIESKLLTFVNNLTMKLFIFIFLILWGLPSTFLRNDFRKIVYKTNDWKINIKPIFLKEIKGLLFNIYPDDDKYLKSRNLYRIYLIIYLILFIIYLNL
tara:strand:+ start:515 stop:811 length:297 start_codon:yes stop_codon:yes gene_type:complete